MKSYFQTYILSFFFLTKPLNKIYTNLNPSRENTIPQYKLCLVSLKYCSKNPGDSVTPIDQKPGQKDVTT